MENFPVYFLETSCHGNQVQIDPAEDLQALGSLSWLAGGRGGGKADGGGGGGGGSRGGCRTREVRKRPALGCVK